MAEQDAIVLGRVGHYHVPSGSGAGSCQTALVVWSGGSGVNLAVWTHDGDQTPRLDVPVSEVAAESATFHLTRDCPYGR